MTLLKLPIVLPQLVLLSPTATDCVCIAWAMTFYQKCWLSVEMVEQDGGLMGEFTKLSEGKG